MRFSRLLREESIRLELATEFPPPPEEGDSKKYERHCKELLLVEFAELLNASGRVNNCRRLLTDMINRERQASTALGGGLAIPHVRSMQARELTMGFCRSSAGVFFDAPDNEPVHIFFLLAAPPYDDRQYLRIYRLLCKLFLETDLSERLMQVENAGEVVRILNQVS